MLFADLRLAEPILRAVSATGYTTATPIQAQAIPLALAGRDVFGCAQTGTGKTAAFALPILHRLSSGQRAPGNNTRARALILSPTRELATQISDDFRTYGKFLTMRQCVIFGGVSQHQQVQSLRRGLDIITATPGRLMDLMQQGHVDLRGIEVLVLDEADRMLDMGFIHDIRKIVDHLPKDRQTLLFSATMPREIKSLADALMKDPVNVQVAAVAATADKVDQSVYFVDRGNKAVLLAHLVNDLPMTRAIVFTRTKHGADRVVRHLHSRGIRSEAIHGNKSQNARQRALDNFRANRIPVLVATDIASRGIDVDGVTHVVNYDLTHEPETYVHRIGRTARAGASGAAVSFCDKEERGNLRAIEKLIRQAIPVMNNHPDYTKSQSQAPVAQPAQRPLAPRPLHTAKGGAPGGRPSYNGNGGAHGGGYNAEKSGRPSYGTKKPFSGGFRQVGASQSNHPQGGRSEGGRPEGARAEGGRAQAGRPNAGRPAPAGQRQRHPLHSPGRPVARQSSGKRR